MKNQLPPATPPVAEAPKSEVAPARKAGLALMGAALGIGVYLGRRMGR